MKKNILFVISFIWLASCTAIDNVKISAAEQNNIERIKEASSKAINEIKGASAEAQKHLNESIIDAVGYGKANIDSLVKSATKGLEESIKKSIDDFNEKTNSIQSDIKNIKQISGVAIALALVSLFFSSFNIFKQRRIRYTIIDVVTDNKRINTKIEAIVEEYLKVKGIVDAPSTRVIINQLQDSQEFNLLVKRMTDKYTTCKAPKLINEEVAAPLQKSNSTVSQNKQKITLFARDSRSGVLDELCNSYKSGKTIYKITVDSMESTTAELDLCTDKEEVVERILKVFTNDDLEAICNIRQIAADPTQIIVIKKGKVKKCSNGEWTVVEKIEIEKK